MTRRIDEGASGLSASLGPAPEGHARPEVVVLRLRRHGRRLVLPVLVLIAAAAATGFWAGSLPEPWMNVLAGAGALAAVLLLFFFPLLAWLAQRVTVTSRRVILRHGFFVRHRSEVAFSRVREVRSRRGIVQRMFGAGDVELLVGAESTTLRDVPGVESVVDALHELMERNYVGQSAAQPYAPYDPYATSQPPGVPRPPDATAVQPFG